MFDSSASQIKLIRKYLKIKILEDNITFRGHNLERQHVYELMKKTVLNGESHSALITGPRGCGKTTLINSVLSQLSQEVDLENDVIIVRLSGLLHHDDKVALKAITAQMQLENTVSGRVFGSFAENITFLLECLRSGEDRRCRSMLFILDELHAFAHSGKTQTLLYNLFDITHNGKAPMCVIGVTSRSDLVELLEKRVKSRFSHRHINLYPTSSENEANCDIQKSTLNTYMDTFIQLLTLPDDLPKKELLNTPKIELLNTPKIELLNTPKKKKAARRKSVGRLEDLKMDVDAKNASSIPKEVLDKCKMDEKKFQDFDEGFIEDWNAHIEGLSREQKVIDAVEKFCYFTVNQQIFRDVLFQIICRLSPRKPYVDASDICSTIDNAVAPRHRVTMLQSLSILELSLVIAMKHGLDIFDGQPMNFEMVLHRYTKFANAHSSAQTVPRPVILKAFEHLQALEVVMPVRGGDSVYSAGDTNLSRVQKEYQFFTLAVPTEAIDEAVKGFKALPTEINHWYTNSVV